MQQRWKATWIEEGGGRQEFVFDSLDNRTIARIDFRLKAPLAGIKTPEHFELEEVGLWNSPTRLSFTRLESI